MSRDDNWPMFSSCTPSDSPIAIRPRRSQRSVFFLVEAKSKHSNKQSLKCVRSGKQKDYSPIRLPKGGYKEKKKTPCYSSFSWSLNNRSAGVPSIFRKLYADITACVGLGLDGTYCRYKSSDAKLRARKSTLHRLDYTCALYTVPPPLYDTPLPFWFLRFNKFSC